MRRSARTANKRTAETSKNATKSTEVKKRKTTQQTLDASVKKLHSRNDGHESTSEDVKPASVKQSKQTKSANEGGQRAKPVILFAHGAGAGSSSDFMQEWKKLLADATDAVDVILFDYPYLAGGKKGAPPKAEKLVDFHMEQLQAAVDAHPGHAVILCGKSMGSRVGAMVAGKDDCPAKAVVCLGYPLKGTNGAIRDETLLELKRPVLFVQGSKDPMGPLEMLEGVRKKMTVRNELHCVDGGDHGLKVAAKKLKELGMSRKEMTDAAVKAVADFIASVE